jgi:acyl-CoA thioesterase II
LHAYFLRPGDPAVPIIYDVQHLREGRFFSVRRLAARQHGRPIFYMSVSFQVAEEGPEHQDAAPPMTDPEGHPTLGEHLQSRRARFDFDVDEEWKALDVRFAGASYPEGTGLQDPAHPALTRVWMRTAGPMLDDRLRAT